MAFIYQQDPSQPPRFTVGQSDFEQVITLNGVFVDKSLAIRDLIDNIDQTFLFPRPRRFGKTLLMTMLKYYFEKSEKSKRHLFEPLQIWQAGEKYQAHQGRYPVIFLSFKDIKEVSFEKAATKFAALLKETFRYHQVLLSSQSLTADEKKDFQAILEGSASQALLESSLHDLSRWLEAHYAEKVILLLDEYDTPIHAAYTGGYYDEMMRFMRSFMGAAFKDNNHLYKGIITGILQVAKESLFSGLNNLSVYSILSEEYGEHFGFTQTELDAILKRFQLTAKAKMIQEWYNGYRFGNLEIYNPWSIINCMNKKGQAIPYWVNTADNTLVQDILAKASPDVKANLEKFIKNEAVTAPVSESIVFNTLKLQPDALYSFLLFTGYLKAQQVRIENFEVVADLAIPNHEINMLFRQIFKHWVALKLDTQRYQDLLKALVTGEVYEFERLLRLYAEASMSYFDADKQPEKFYHGFILGVLVGLQQTHEVKSNRESGFGRADILVIPKDRSQLGVVLEFKRADKAEDLEASADNALAQIAKLGYASELQGLGISKILTLGVAFFGKQICLKQA